MVRSAIAALLAAIEIYNKPKVEYREQTFAILLTNAWEILLKARIIQQSGGKLASIYRKERGKYVRNPETHEPMTIGLRPALARVPVPNEVGRNIQGVYAVRNSATHMGILAPDLTHRILAFGTASVQNFMKLTAMWFGVTVEAPYLLPVGFVGQAVLSSSNLPNSQRRLLVVLEQLGHISTGSPASDFAVLVNVDINLNRNLVGGGTIGLTNDPSAPSVKVSDDEALQYYSVTRAEIEDVCRQRYPNFKRNGQFNQVMNGIKSNPNCAYERRLDPDNPKTAKKYFYNESATLAKLDELYQPQDQTQ